MFSLRVQRCFLRALEQEGSSDVFSACAEMFLQEKLDRLKEEGFLCVCRDVSLILDGREPMGQFSLRVQRCFHL